MTYSQKYCLVHFIDLNHTPQVFEMSEWPLHVTFVNAFAIDRDSIRFDHKLRTLLGQTPRLEVSTTRDTVLGTTNVVLIDRTQPLNNLHIKLVDLIEDNGGLLNNPEFNREGYIPHSTIQKAGRLSSNQHIYIDHISLVDMFPNRDWRQRKVLTTLDLGQK